MNLVNTLPGIVPTARSYAMGEWPQRRMKMRNGRTTRWGLANMSTGEKFELVWENVTHAEAQQLVQVWDLNYGIYGKVTLPPEVFAGTELSLYLATLDDKLITAQSGEVFVAKGTDSGGLSGLMAAPFPSTSWRFTEPPRVSAVKAGRCTVSMSLGAKGFIVQEP